MIADTQPMINSVLHEQWCSRMSDLSVSAYLIIRRTPFFFTPSVRALSDDIAQLTGFTGSNACLLWFPTGQGVLYTDDRYTLQARQECPHVTVVNMLDMGVDVARRVDDQFIALNGWMWSAHEAANFPFAKSIVWDCSVDQQTFADPQLLAPIHGLPNPSGFQNKCHQILGEQSHEEAWVVCDPFLASWWINARSLDHPTSPIIDGYLLIQRQGTRYVGVLCVSWPRTVHELDSDITIVPWQSLHLWMTQPLHRAKAPTQEECGVSAHAQGGSEDDQQPPQQPLFPEASLVNHAQDALQEALPLGVDVAWCFDPRKTPHNVIQDSWKMSSFGAKAAAVRSVKNEWEQHHARQAHVKDSVAWIEWLAWLDRLPHDSAETEMTAAQQLEQCRLQQSSYVCPSFEPISAVGTNSSVIHYHPQAHTARPLVEGLYLMDSGGQYRYGTTDVTRTLWLGSQEPPLQIKRAYTAVLQGLIHGISMRFPPHTTGAHIDTIIRSFVWQQGWDYPHSTGHGVGSFLCVHEAPPTLSQRSWSEPLVAGHVTSIEPGFYQAAWGGIRLENVALITPDAFVPQWLMFESLTLVPFDRSLVMPDLLCYAQRLWLDRYHKRINQTLSPLLTPAARQWLAHQTRPLETYAM